MNDQNLAQNNDIEVLKLVERFGFKFFGYDENKLSLVVAPNGQIVQLKVAYEFVQKQIESAQSFSGGPESMPNMPTITNIPEGNFESNLERESTIEKVAEKKQEVQSIQTPQVPQVPVAKPVVTKPEDPDSPYGDGFKTPINPVHIDKAMDYIRKNSRKSLSSTSRWLSVQFEKFVNEQKSSK